jgi:beta-glucosidase
MAVTVTNTGARAGKQVVQVYGGPPQDGVTRRLIGFAKVDLEPGESRRIDVDVERRSLARFDVDANLWRIDEGEYEISVASSSADVPEVVRVRLAARELPA